jgi:hypothetical protein
MINTISEGTIRGAVKIDPNGSLQKEMTQQKAEEARRRRPVENTAAGGKSESRHGQDSESLSRYEVEGKVLVYKKYNRAGDLVYRLPPPRTPLDELA